MNHPTIIALNLEDKLDIQGFVNYCKTRFIECEILIASKTKHTQTFGATEFVFENASDNVVLNTLIPAVTGNRMVVVREIDKDSYKDLDLFINKLTKNNQICVYKKDRNKVQEICYEYANKFINLLFGYKLYPGDISIISFAKTAIETLKQLDNCSMYTKVNDWTGIEFVEIDQHKPAPIRFKTNNKNNYIRMSVEFTFFVVALLCWLLIPYVQQTLLSALCALVCVLSICLVLIEIILICVKRFVGENECVKIDISEKQNKGE